jgi:hypothetical protein
VLRSALTDHTVGHTFAPRAPTDERARDEQPDQDRADADLQQFLPISHLSPAVPAILWPGRPEHFRIMPYVEHPSLHGPGGRRGETGLGSRCACLLWRMKRRGTLACKLVWRARQDLLEVWRHREGGL